MAEEFVQDNRGFVFPVDFKVSCFDGIPRYLIVFFGRSSVDYTNGRYIINKGVPEPVKLDAIIGTGHRIPNVIRDPFLPPSAMRKMLELSTELSAGIDHLRVDFYYANHQLLFGERTLYFGSGFTRYDPDSFDYRLGSWWEQPY